MACIDTDILKFYTGTEIVRVTKMPAIGHFDAARIDADIEALGDGSEMGIALRDMQQWATTCELDFPTMTDAQCLSAQMALKWLTVWRYRKFDIEHIKTVEDCCEDDTRALHFACQQVRVFLNKVSSCMMDQFDTLEDDLKEKDCRNLPENAFSGSLITSCDCEGETFSA